MEGQGQGRPMAYAPGKSRSARPRCMDPRRGGPQQRHGSRGGVPAAAVQEGKQKGGREEEKATVKLTEVPNRTEEGLKEEISARPKLRLKRRRGRFGRDMAQMSS